MKTNYTKLSDDELANARLLAFNDINDHQPRGPLNNEFLKRFPRMGDNKNAKPIEPMDDPPWMTDVAPSFLEETPECMKKSMKAKTKHTAPD